MADKVSWEALGYKPEPVAVSARPGRIDNWKGQLLRGVRAGDLPANILDIIDEVARDLGHDAPKDALIDEVMRRAFPEPKPTPTPASTPASMPKAAPAPADPFQAVLAKMVAAATSAGFIYVSTRRDMVLPAYMTYEGKPWAWFEIDRDPVYAGFVGNHSMPGRVVDALCDARIAPSLREADYIVAHEVTRDTVRTWPRPADIPPDVLGLTYQVYMPRAQSLAEVLRSALTFDPILFARLRVGPYSALFEIARWDV